MKQNYRSGLRVLTLAALFVTGGLASCSDDDKGGTTPPPELTDQIQYGETVTDIKSVIYDVEDTDLYTFYLSPTAGITDVMGMTAAADFLKVTLRNPQGTVNMATDEFEVKYKDIAATNLTMNDIEKCQLSVDLATPTRLNLYAEVVLKTGKRLHAKYNNACDKAFPEIIVLRNQYELDGEVASIGSVLAWHNSTESTTTYCFYSKSGVTAPSDDVATDLQITLSDGDEIEADFAEVDLGKVKVTCGTFESADGTTGTLTVQKDKLGTTLTVSLDAVTGDSHLRAAYTGAFVTGYESRNYLKVVNGETTSETPLTTVFRKEPTNARHLFAMGDATEQTTPVDLMQGHYAVQFSVVPSAIGQTLDLAVSQNECTLIIYDYQTYEFWSMALTRVTGQITTALGDGGNVYLRFNAEFAGGPAIEAEWYGPVKGIEEEFDLKPVKPFQPHVWITSPQDELLVDKEILALEVRMEKGYKWNGGPKYGGATFDAYFFYIRTTNDPDDLESNIYTPQLVIPAEFVDLSGKELDLTVAQDNLYWDFTYTGENQLCRSYESYGSNYKSTYSETFRCPDVARVSVSKQDKTWKFSFTMLDYGLFGSWGTPSYKSGTENVLNIEWEGPATKYSGSKTNDLADEDY